MAAVLVVGDTIIDEYVFGNIERVNPEAPWSAVLDFERSKMVLGGAANVAANIKTLSQEQHEVMYLGYTSPLINKLLREHQIASLPTKFLYDEDILKKTRLVHDNHILLRLDTNKDYKTFVNTDKSDDLKMRVSVAGKEKIDLLVISDYNKKTLSNELILAALEKHPEAALLFDIKKAYSKEVLQKFPAKTIIKCNYKEWAYLNDIGFWTSVEWKKGWYILRTNGKYGYTLIDRMEEYSFVSMDVGEIVDTVGCGDVFLSGMAVDYLSSLKFDPLGHAEFANRCAAIKVKKFGTATVSHKEINV